MSEYECKYDKQLLVENKRLMNENEILRRYMSNYCNVRFYDDCFTFFSEQDSCLVAQSLSEKYVTGFGENMNETLKQFDAAKRLVEDHLNTNFEPRKDGE